jgi:hypothetical protein
VVLFTELERQVLTAATQGNRATLEALVADDFQLWTADDPTEPMDRTRWIAQLLSAGGPVGAVRQMNVILKSDTAIVSFMLTRPPSAGTGTTDRFLVDIWSQRADTWQLAARYACESPHQGAITPSGKE